MILCQNQTLPTRMAIEYGLVTQACNHGYSGWGLSSRSVTKFRASLGNLARTCLKIKSTENKGWESRSMLDLYLSPHNCIMND